MAGLAQQEVAGQSVANDPIDGAKAHSNGDGNGSVALPTRRRATAQSMAAAQRDISVSEFFAKNRHLLGFDNPRKALLTTVKEAVDNEIGRASCRERV
jgi:DNA topoisomerase VI subunit B